MMLHSDGRPRSTALQKLLDAFAEELPQRVEKLLALAPGTDAPPAEALVTYGQASHKLAGSSGSYGFREISLTIRALDAYLHDCVEGNARWSTTRHAELAANIRKALDA